ncbi:MAG: protoporphyrinogen oxidase HemJ [Alphaproteobacteria bacterium]|nr:protoporphyrinogen oxidase HemJ [Alphaproteobacteria bacterium]
MNDAYHWLKTLHLLAVIAWMAGQLYLPRLFAYHAQAIGGGEASETFKVMERRLMRGIMNPAMIATFIFGIALAVKLNAFAPVNGYWLHAKLSLVLMLAASHGLMGRWRKRFAQDANTHSPRFYKVFNEVQTALMIGVVALVVFKPF